MTKQLTPEEYKKTFTSLSKKKYQDQAIWFLNGYWSKGAKEEAENIKKYLDGFIKLDRQSTPPRGPDGNELDQFWSAKFLEDFGSTMTASERKEALKVIDQDSNGKMSLLEFLVWHYKKSVAETVDSPQGENQKEIDAAAAKMKLVQDALDDVLAKTAANQKALEESKQAIKAAEEAIESSKQAEEKVRAAEAQVRAAEAELAAAVQDLKDQEQAKADKISSLEAKSTDESLSTVKRSQAAAELAQAKQEDSMPLRKAKITQEAALKKVQKQREAAEEASRRAADAVAFAEGKKREAEEKKQSLERAGRELDQARADLEAKMDEAAKELEEVKKKGGVSYGNLWYMERALFDADASLARAKQKYDHSKPFQFHEK